jgi:membrane associated rhomboid family serine protease
VILPIGDEPNPRGVPYVTYLLIAVNVLLYGLLTIPLSTTPPDLENPAVAEYLDAIGPELHRRIPVQVLLQSLSEYDLFVFAHGFRPGAPSLADLFFSLFLHAGFLHLAGNMLFLWIYGDNVEHRLGPGRYLLAYLGAGIGASLFHALAALGSTIPTIGASGAISGVLGFYFLWFPRNRVRLLWLFPPFFMNVFFVPARLVLGLYIIADNLLPFLIARNATGVAHGAHIGGFVAGLGAAWLIDRWALASPPREYARRRVVPLRSAGSDSHKIAQKIAEGLFGEAATDYFSLAAAATHRLLSPDDAMELAGWLRRNGHPEATLTVLRRHLRDYPTGPRRAEAHIAAGSVLREEFHEPTAAYQHFLAALDLDPEPELAALARDGIRAIEALQKLQIGRPRSFRQH